MRRNRWVAVVGLVLAACSPGPRSDERADAQALPEAPPVTMVASPTCGCCAAWAHHMRRAGFPVTVRHVSEAELQAEKDRAGVPRGLRSCHTARVGGYVLEGHVPAEMVAALLARRPAVRGLAVPGMPMGSPGMEGPRSDPYEVISFDSAGRSVVVARYP